MIRLRVVAGVLGKFLFGVAAVMLLPTGLALLDPQESEGSFALSTGITAVAAAALRLAPRREDRYAELSVREGLLVATMVWFTTCAFGALPFYFSPHFPSLTDALFESVSGFTTTGSTVLSKVEVLSGPMQFWRCATHWFGGMGILLLVIAILPLLGAGGMHLYRAEFSGAKSERLKPRITETALALWKIYVALTVAEYLALRLAGMGRLDAVCHSMSTLGTGGFSTRTASAADFRSPVIEYVIVVFMVLAGINFTRHYRLWVERKPRGFFDPEVRAFLVTIAAASSVLAGWLMLRDGYAPSHAFRAGLFQVSSIITTTGFVTEDFERWAPFAQLFLLALMFIGGCTGSTAGGLKIARILMLFKVVGRELHRIVERRGVFTIRLGGQPVPEAAIQSVLNIFYLSFLVNFTASLILTATGLDVLTSISAVAASMFNVGPGLGAVGPLEHYGNLPVIAKWTLMACMIAGRLEFYTAMVIFSPAFWRK